MHNTTTQLFYNHLKLEDSNQSHLCQTRVNDSFLFSSYLDRLQQREASSEGVEEPPDARRRRHQTTLDVVHPPLSEGVLRRVPARSLQQPHVHRQGGSSLLAKSDCLETPLSVIDTAHCWIKLGASLALARERTYIGIWFSTK